MKLQDQVITLEQAKMLSQLGITQGLSAFFWDDYEGKEELRMNAKPEGGYSPGSCNTCFSAFTVAELGVMLPFRMRDEEKRENPHLRIYRGENEWHVEYHQVFSRPYIRSYAYENLSDAMAHVLIHLLENKLITVEEVNARLCA